MRRKQVNNNFAPIHGQSSPINRRLSITDSLQEITKVLTAEQQIGKPTLTACKASLENIPVTKEQYQGNALSNLDQHKQAVTSVAEKPEEKQQLIKEMLDWKHKYHALENEKQKLAIHTEENVKRLEQGFRLELAATVEAHLSKIEEISDELQRLVSENQAFRKQLAMNNIEPVTTFLETGLDEHNSYTNDDIQFLKDVHQSTISTANDTADLSENLKSSIENTIQAIDFELNLLKVGNLVPKDELVALAREHHERTAGQVAKDTILKAIPNLFTRGKSDRRKSKALTRTDSIDNASIKSYETTSSRGVTDRRPSLDSSRFSCEYQYMEDVARASKSAATDNGFRARLTTNLTDVDINLDAEDEDEKVPTPTTPVLSQMRPPYVLRQHSKKTSIVSGVMPEPQDMDKIVPGVDGLNARPSGIAWTKRKRIAVPINALPPSLSSSQSCPSHLHR